MNITIQSHSNYSPIGDMAFTANWSDDTHRYHVWLGLRPDVEGERILYPVKISETIYKNTIADSRRANTIKMNINAAVNAKVKAEIKRLAKYDTLIALFTAHRATIKAFDTMRAEADRLNAIFNAYKVLENATINDKRDLGLI